ncbi:hypothetical protein COB55_00365 [Candidatus Wolfebacteria bacterium]|nr:MAG: hypothetical protein COB55_00365 [Candidatus Wolfebacteria bacterium]
MMVDCELATLVRNPLNLFRIQGMGVLKGTTSLRESRFYPPSFLCGSRRHRNDGFFYTQFLLVWTSMLENIRNFTIIAHIEKGV